MKTWKQFVEDARNFNLSDEQLESVHEFYEKIDPEYFDTMLRRIPLDLPQQEIEEKFPNDEYKKFLFLLIASSWNYLEGFYKAQHYPLSMLEDIRNDFRLWCDKLTLDFGYAGLNWHIFDWCISVLTGNILQFGRLQCSFPQSFTAPVSLVRENGVLQIRNTKKHQTGALLEYGDPVIKIHIPAGKPLKRELCIDSLRKIVEFAKEYTPYYNYRGIYCFSWTLNPAFAQMNPQSNLADFQKLGHTFDLFYDATGEVLWRVFNAKVQNEVMQRSFNRLWQLLSPRNRARIKTRPMLAHIFDFKVRTEKLDSLIQKTTIQKNVVSHLKNGKKFTYYGLAILKEEIPQLLDE